MIHLPGFLRRRSKRVWTRNTVVSKASKWSEAIVRRVKTWSEHTKKPKSPSKRDLRRARQRGRIEAREAGAKRKLMQRLEASIAKLERRQRQRALLRQAP